MDESKLHVALSSSSNSKDIEELSQNSESKFDKWAYFRFLSYPNLLIVSMLGILVAVQNVFFDVCRPIFLQNQVLKWEKSDFNRF